MRRAQALPTSRPAKRNGHRNGHSNGNGHGNGHTDGHAQPLPIADAHPVEDPDNVTTHQSADQDLVDRCKAGDGLAWAEIHTKCHGHLVRQIRFTLGDRGRDANLVEEIAARVWFTLFADDGYLLGRFEPIKGSGVEKYLAAIARFEVMRHQRSEFRRRRRERETHALRQTVRNERDFVDMELDVAEFLPNLTRRERQYFDCVLLGGDGEEMMDVSAPNAWQLRHRIRKKLLSFLDLE